MGRDNSNLGKSPTNSQKLIYITQKLGLSGIAGMQGSTVNLFDTIVLTASTQPQILEFFSNTAKKSLNFTNFQNGTLGAGETLTLERLNFFAVILDSTDLTSDANSIDEVIPLSELNSALGGVVKPGSLTLSQCAISIANQTVVKSFNIFECIPAFNPATTGADRNLISTAALPVTELGMTGQNGIVLEAPPVLPPNQGLKIALRVLPTGNVAATLAIVCVVGRFGSIYASKATL